MCGDQSSGKSSILEAISGVSFPVKSNLCTRFPTELVLRRTPYISERVSIVPNEFRPETERKALLAFGEELDGFDNLPHLVKRAKAEMGITAYGRAFAKDILRIEVTGPDQPHLTIVDLPGLIYSETKNQTTSDIKPLLVSNKSRAAMATRGFSTVPTTPFRPHACTATLAGV